MAPGATTISGGYTVADAAVIETHIETLVTSIVSGAQVFILPDANNGQFYVGVTEQKN